MTTLLVGFDSAWTSTNSGALVGTLLLDDGTFHELGPPRAVGYPEAEDIIFRWQAEQLPTATIVLLDQPTIVKNPAGQRPVENLLGSAVSLRYGGMQPANTAREKMFGKEAPVWPFLARFSGPADPLEPVAGTRVFETYPVLAMIALGWTLPDSRAAGRLPKYNPRRKKAFSRSDWQHVCSLASGVFCERGLVGIVQWIDAAGQTASPRKRDQDGLDACLCRERIVEMIAKVFWITGPWRGRLGIVPRPRGAEWLDEEARAWREAGIDAVVSLLEPAEEAELALTGEPAASAASGLEFRSFPIADRSVPNSREAVAQLVDQIVHDLRAGKSVALHCRQGIGRSAIVAAAALIADGETAETAIKTVQQSRGLEVPETHEQRQWISDFSSWLASTRAAKPRHATDGAPRPS